LTPCGKLCDVAQVTVIGPVELTATEMVKEPLTTVPLQVLPSGEGLVTVMLVT
jgi:hypothetical protein